MTLLHATLPLCQLHCPLCCSSRMPNKHLPQGLCTCCLLSLEYISPEIYRLALLLHPDPCLSITSLKSSSLTFCIYKDPRCTSLTCFIVLQKPYLYLISYYMQVFGILIPRTLKKGKLYKDRIIVYFVPAIYPQCLQWHLARSPQ